MTEPRRVYIWERTDKTLSPLAKTTVEDAELYCDMVKLTSEKWTLLEFVELEWLCDWLARYDKGHWRVKDLRDALSDAKVVPDEPAGGDE